MKILFDQNMPRLLRRFLRHHEVRTAEQMGWDKLKNGHLIKAGEDNRFDVFVTCDKDIRYQQNLSRRTIAIVHLCKNNWPSMEPHIPRIIASIDEAIPGSYKTIDYAYVYKPRKKAPKA